MVQRKKIIERQQNEHTIALEGQHPQVGKFAIKKKLDIEMCTTEHIRRWIYFLKQIKKRAEKHERNDIRSYFELEK